MTNANADRNADSAIDPSRTLIPSSYSLLGHDYIHKGVCSQCHVEDETTPIRAFDHKLMR